MPRPTRILVVDDDAGIRQMLSLTLRESGHEVRVADARERIELGDAEVVIIDFRLGDRTAEDVLREQPELGRVALIVMTAAPAPRDVVAGIVPEVTILSKPFDLDALDSAIAKAVLRASRRGATRPLPDEAPGS